MLYNYDVVSRLTSIVYQASSTNYIAYRYDSTGNRASQGGGFSVYNLPSAVPNSLYDVANHQLTFGTYNMLYDLDGNVTSIINATTTNTLLWSARNQLTNMLGAVAATFAYDGVGRRISRTVSSTTEKYAYDGLDTVLQKDSGGSVAARYFRGLSIDEPWQRIDSTSTRDYMADALGSTVAMADTNGVIRGQYAYEPFGATTMTGALTNSYKFTGREDDGTALYYYRARYYHPALGRFVSEDPLDGILRLFAESVTRSTSDINLFVYGYDSPVMLIDPLGLFTFTFGTSASGGAGGGGQGSTGIAISYSTKCGFQIGSINSVGVGGYAGVNGSLGAQLAVSGNQSINDLGGRSGEVGGGGGEGIVAGASVSIQRSGAAPVYAGSVGFGVGLTPVDAHGFENWTRVDMIWTSRGSQDCGCK